MKVLQIGRETDIVAGGAGPQIACDSSGNAAHSERICQTFSGLTIITRTDTTESGGSGSLGLWNRLVGGEAKGEGSTKTTTTTVTVCKSDGECTNLPPTVTKDHASNDSDGSSVDNIADANAAFDQIGADLGSADGFESFAGDGFGGDFGGGFGGGFGGDGDCTLEKNDTTNLIA